MSAPLIHIGYQKTGTTFLQAHVFKNAEKGFASNWTLRSGESIEHFVLTHPQRFDPASIRAEFEAAHAGLPEGTIPVISHEDLSGHPVLSRYYGFETARRVHKVFPDAKILIGIREQRSMLRSLYGQYVRQDGEWSIEGFLGQGELPPGFQAICRLDHFEYHLLADYYVELFGMDNVLVLPIEMLKKSPLEYEQAIHDFAGSGANSDRVHDQTYAGLGAMTLSLLRRINKLVKRPPDWNGRYDDLPLTYRAKSHFIRHIDSLIPKSWHKKYDRRLKDFVKNRVGDFYAASNRALAARYGLSLADFGYDVGAATTPMVEASENGQTENASNQDQRIDTPTSA